MYLIKINIFQCYLIFLYTIMYFISKNIIVLLKKIICRVPSIILNTQNGTAYYLLATN